MFTALACALVAVASADTTTWTNPNGGVWSDPANWSNGTPGPTDAVLLPPLDADGYTIVVDGQYACATLTIGGATACDGSSSEGPPIELFGGSLYAAGSVSIGGPGLAGSLVLRDHFLNSFALRVGVGDAACEAIGHLALRGTGTVTGWTTDVGKDGVGTLELDPSTVAYANQWSNFDGATLHFNVAPGSSGLISTTAFARDGELRINVLGAWSLPSPSSTLISSISNLTGAFDAVESDVVEGYTIPITSDAKQITIPYFDPVVSLSIECETWPPAVGFEHDLWFWVTRYSGTESSACWSTYCPWSFEVVGGEAHFGSGLQKDFLTVDGPGELTIRLTNVDFGGSFTQDFVLSPLVSPYVYQRIATSVSGANLPDGSGFGDFAGPRWSDDARFTAFSSYAELLGCDPHPDKADIFVKDRVTGAVDCISILDGATPGHAREPDISGDGRFVVYRNLVGASSQIWLFDRWTRETTLVSRTPTGQQANGVSQWPRIANDGSTIVFVSSATDLGPPAIGGVDQIYAFDTLTHAMALISADVRGQPGIESSGYPSLSADGRFVVFDTTAPNLVGAGGDSHIVLRDRVRGVSEIVDRHADGTPFNGSADLGLITPSGRFIAFNTDAPEVGDSDSSSMADAFVFDREAGTFDWVSPTLPGTMGSHSALAISDDGQNVAYAARTPSTQYLELIVAVFHRTTATWEWATPDPWGNPAIVVPSMMELSAQGDQLLFTASEDGLLPFAVNIANPAVRIFHPLEPADLNGDGSVNAGDLAILLAAWGTPNATADLDRDGIVAAGDLAAILAAWSV